MPEAWRKRRGYPISPQKYVNVHESYMEHFYQHGIIRDDTPEWDFSETPVITLEGKIFFGEGLCLNVDKTLREYWDKRGRRLVRTDKYAYNLNFEGKKSSEIFRYDNFDVKPRRGHKSPHHCHRYDPPGRQVLNSPFELQADEVPTLGEVIVEAYSYYTEHLASRKVRAPKKK